MAYTTNLCINPSFQQGLLGVKTITGDETTAIDTSEKIFSLQSLLVTLPGKVGGEGVYLPGGVIPQAANCSVSLYIYGQGNFVVTAILDADGSSFSVETNTPVPDTDAVPMASIPVAVSPSWQRVIINNLYVGTAGQVLYMSVRSTTPQATAFWVGGIQIEPESPAQDYIDGDLDDCTWIDFPYGRSVKQWRHPFHLIGTVESDGNTIVPMIAGAVTPATLLPGVSFTTPDLIPVGTTVPVGAMTDFAIWTTADPDPAETYVSWNNSGLTVPSGSWSRVWATFIPSLDYLNSSGLNTWNRTAYLDAGFEFSNVPAGATVQLDDIQVELLPILGGYGASTPTSYVLPRQISSIIKPDRLNFVLNPSFETSIANWSAVGGGTLSADAHYSAGNIVSFDEAQQTAGVSSLLVNCTTAGDGASTTITDLIPGNMYIASAYVTPGQGISNITMSCSGSFTTLVQTGGIGYGLLGYGTGQPYGGISAPSADVNPNLLSAADADFETGTADWLASQGTSGITQSNVQAHTGSNSMLITSAGTAVRALALLNKTYTATPGEVVAMSGWFWTATANRKANFGLNLYSDAAGQNFVSNVSVVQTPLTASTWTYSEAEFNIPLTGVLSYKPFMGVQANSGNTGNGELCYVDTVKLNQLLWSRLWFVFTANSDTVTLSFVSSFAADFLDPTYFWVDAVLVELGQLLQNYFDGGFGTNYFWDGSPGQSRSYYYKQFNQRLQAWINTLAKHVPVGISYSTPQTATPYGQ